jgi:hypothetical protein
MSTQKRSLEEYLGELIWGRFICPFCYNSYPRYQVEYKCRDTNCKLNKEAHHPAITEFGQIKCPNDNTFMIRVCKIKICKKEISDNILKSNFPFSIIGITNSGKTTYITMMLNELGKLKNPVLNLSSDDKYTKDHQDKIYEKLKKLQLPKSTISGKLTPQLWCINNKHRNNQNKSQKQSFTIFDGAGEDHQKRLTITEPEMNYIKCSKAIILTLDPLILESVKKKKMVDDSVRKHSLSGGTEEKDPAHKIVKDLILYINEARKGKRCDAPIKIPVAIIFTKIDTIIHTFSPNSPIHSPNSSIINGQVDLPQINDISNYIRSWLVSNQEHEFIDSLKPFENYRFFGVSSLRYPPKADLILDRKPEPHRVLDPILWLFKDQDLID